MITTDRFVTHTSTVPATRGQTVSLFVREKALAPTTAPGAKPHVVLIERGRHLLYRATQSWLASGAVDRNEQGEFFADARGRLSPAVA